MRMSSCCGCRERREKHEKTALDTEHTHLPGRRIRLLQMRGKKPAALQKLPALREQHDRVKLRPDLSGLLDLPNLRMVRVSRTMEDAIRSLDGVDYHFELFVEG